MSSSSSSSELCYANLPATSRPSHQTYPFPYQHNSIYIFAEPSKSSLSTPCRKPPRAVRHRSCICSCFLWLSALVIILIFLTVLLFFLLFFYIHPKFPDFHLDHVALSQFKVTNDSGDLLLSSQCNVTVQVTNKNTILRFRYGDFNITVWLSGSKDKEVLLGRGIASGFEQGQRNVTLVKSKISVQSEIVDANTAEDIVDRMKGGELTVDAEMSTSMKVNVGDWNLLKILVHLLCKGTRPELRKEEAILAAN